MLYQFLALLTVATTVKCAPELITAQSSHVRTITAELKPTTTSRFIPTVAQLVPGFCGPFCSVHLN